MKQGRQARGFLAGARYLRSSKNLACSADVIGRPLGLHSSGGKHSSMSPDDKLIMDPKYTCEGTSCFLRTVLGTSGSDWNAGRHTEECRDAAIADLTEGRGIGGGAGTTTTGLTGSGGRTGMAGSAGTGGVGSGPRGTGGVKEGMATGTRGVKLGIVTPGGSWNFGEDFLLCWSLDCRDEWELLCSSSSES